MRLQVYTVYDKAVNAYMQPFYCRTKGEAIRSFTEACCDKKSNFFKYATDYVLMELGEYDDQTGLFASREPMRIVSAHEIIPDDVFNAPEEPNVVPPRVVM